MAQTNSVQREPSMEEILASIRKIIEDSDGVRKTTEDAFSDFASPVRAPSGAPRGEVEAFRADLSYPPDDEAAAETRTEQVHFSDEPSSEARKSATTDAEPSSLYRDEPAIATEAPQSDPWLLQFSTSAPVPESRNILSERAGRQIAQSFGELSDAFLASRRKSFDEIAEDMLRPMLQDWLDNNLPVLVERLVREEIERVARGVAG